MLKFLGLLLVIVFFIWFIKYKWQRKKMQWRGETIPEQKGLKGLRPITLLSAVFVVMYGGYIIWYVLDAWLAL
ncbi:hypothetical protein THIAE_03455 [Thiomicrospira aerophila AL3]|uniref:Uncharacterized protein n=1 Tax=Thiomicrospira aerophila AL3 TaxID=717772 RepID=W0DVR0_9GAMM|nr:hypothetical protein [Thiomicrospira aerophila]AHF00966.1 hypothetical protein THIAE_03455 [Thiomicrospira aerophila AL3]